MAMGKRKQNQMIALLGEDKKDGSDGVVGEEQGGSGDNKLNREGVEDESGQAVQGEAVAQFPQQNSQSSACWETFLHLRSIKVLLVENDDSTRHVVTALLRNCNYEVIEAANGLQAWKLLENLANHIDLVLTEVVMPSLSGIGLLCKIMSHRTRKNVPVIMMSSHDSMGLVFKCLSKGAVDFLVKPIRKNELKNLWLHVWRRCHSSSGSGSESGTQTQKSVESISVKKYDNSSSNDGDNNGSFGLNTSDGSDSGSGIQSSWTKQAAEVDSSHAVSPSDKKTECPDSTCAQVIRPNTKAFGDKCVPVTATRECQALGEHLDDAARGKELVIGRPGHQDFYPELPIDVPAKLTGRKQKTLCDINLNPFIKKIEKRDINPNVENPSTKYKVGNTNAPDPQTGSRGFRAPKGLAKDVEIKDSDSERLPTIELGLKSFSEVRDIGKTIKDNCNILRHSELLVFSRYNTALNASRAPNENTGSGYLLDHCLDEMKKELVCSSQPRYQCSNGFIISNNNIDMASSTNNDVSKPNGFCLSTFKPLKIEHICTSQQAILVKANDRATTVVLAPPRGSHQDLPMQHLHHHYNQFEKEQKQPPYSHDDWNDKLAVDAPPCGSSNVLSGPIEGNTGIYSLNRSASGSNPGRNGQNGSSTAANAEGMIIASVNAFGGKSRSGDGSGNNSNENKLTKREVAMTKFCQKRKERCFQKKVRYQSRKRLAEQRPRVYGQFVRHSAHENSSSAAAS